MQLLLDTHTFIWFISGDQALPQKALDAIKNTENKCYISIASIWEIAIKFSLKKLELKSDFDIEVLQITFQHLQKIINLEFHHRDPFDRLIIAQAIVENLTIITKDENFSRYTDSLFWK
jgi:PIN domain nuclease of toxin-antitoxin system